MYGESFRPKINFMGLYDSVNSSIEVDPKDLIVDPTFVKQTSHMIAADEKRAAFPADSVIDPSMPRPSNVNEVMARGVHANIGAATETV